MKTSYVLISHMKVHNANALSSTMTIGTPALTAFLGFVHALERKLPKQHSVSFSKVGICVHQLTVQQFKGIGDDAFSLIGTSNPLDKKGERPSFIEEAHCDLEVSLLLQIPGVVSQEFTCWMQNAIQCMKFAGGDIESVLEVKELVETDLNSVEKILTRKLMPGFWLVERKDLMQQAMNEGKDALQALLSYLAVHVNMQKKSGVISQTYFKKESGWFVPIVVGYQGLTPIGLADNQRDLTTDHCFAEPVITLGEYKMVHRMRSIEEILWFTHFDSENNLYLCKSQN